MASSPRQFKNETCGPNLDNAFLALPHGLLAPNIAYAMVFVPLYYGIHLVAWNSTYPPPIEGLFGVQRASYEVRMCLQRSPAQDFDYKRPS